MSHYHLCIILRQLTPGQLSVAIEETRRQAQSPDVEEYDRSRLLAQLASLLVERELRKTRTS